MSGSHECDAALGRCVGARASCARGVGTLGWLPPAARASRSAVAGASCSVVAGASRSVDAGASCSVDAGASRSMVAGASRDSGIFGASRCASVFAASRRPGPAGGAAPRPTRSSAFPGAEAVTLGGACSCRNSFGFALACLLERPITALLMFMRLGLLSGPLGRRGRGRLGTAVSGDDTTRFRKLPQLITWRSVAPTPGARGRDESRADAVGAAGDAAGAAGDAVGAAGDAVGAAGDAVGAAGDAAGAAGDAAGAAGDAAEATGDVVGAAGDAAGAAGDASGSCAPACAPYKADCSYDVLGYSAPYESVYSPP